MYCTWESIDTDRRPQTTDGHTLNLSYYLKTTEESFNSRVFREVNKVIDVEFKGKR